MTRTMINLQFSSALGAVLLASVTMFTDATGQFARLEKDDWQAHWIWRPGEHYGNAWIAYRKTFDLTDKPVYAIANIAVDSKYWLWVNGEMVVRDGGLKRGPTPLDTYYDVVDIAHYLEAGSNTIAVLVWYWGRSGFSHVDSGRGGLLFEADIDGVLIRSDNTWKTQRHPSFGWTGPPVPNFRLSEYNVLFDARQGMSGWMDPDFDAGSWQPAVMQAQPPGGPWNRLFERPIPQWRDSGLQPYVDAPAFPFESTGDTLVVSLPYGAQVTPYFRIEAPEGLTIDMRTDQYSTLSLDGVTKINSVRAEYITRSGEQDFEMPEWMSGEAVRYHFPAGVNVLDLKYRETGYDADFEGWFTSSDDLLNRLWIKARRTTALSMRGYLMETSDRERKQGTGDATLALLSALYSFDRRIDPLLRKYWSELEAWRRPDGVFLSGVPGNWGIELSQPNLYSFGDLGVWNYYLHTGDVETIRALYPAIRSYLLLWKLEPSGLIERRTTEWNWYDWGVNIDEPLIENAWYYLALRGAVKMAGLTGNPEDIPEWTSRMETLKAAYNRELWDVNRYHTEGQYGEPDDRGNALAILADFPTVPMRGHLNRLLRSEQHASPYMENFVLAALFHLGDADAAIARMKERYCEMIESDYSTLLEFWDSNTASKSHQFGSGTLRILSHYVAGIQPTEAGFKQMRIAPMIGALDWVDAGVPTVHGIASVRVETVDRPPQGDPALTMRVSIPSGTSAIVGVPLRPGVLSRIEVADRIVWEGERGVLAVDGVNPIEMTLSHVYFLVAS
ncbi:MAG TPA: alpha-L-rhamnosidase C-terminal domain-containing protein, partial [Rhodothermia bacterium]